MKSKNSVRAWSAALLLSLLFSFCGCSSGQAEPQAEQTQSSDQSETVYVTRTGEKHHRSGCEYLRKSKIAISLDDATSDGYTACSKCN